MTKLIRLLSLSVGSSLLLTHCPAVYLAYFLVYFLSKRNELVITKMELADMPITAI